MSKFNYSTKDSSKTTNISGHVAYSMSDKEKLVTQVFTTFFNESKFYGDNSEDIVKTVQNLLNTDPKFIANLAIFARTVMNLRSISHVLVAELAYHVKGKEFARKAIEKIVIRPDDMSEILTYYLTRFGKPIPNSLKKGLGDAFSKFNEYSLAKYDNANKAVKLKDILNLTHPAPDSLNQSDLWKRVLENRLEVPITWETQLSTRGNTREVWEELILENRLGYMALLRNLKNIFQAGVSQKALEKVYELLGDEERVLKNRQLPFRYYSAYKVLSNNNLGSSKIAQVLEKAIKISTQNIEQLPGRTLIAADVSGSMNGTISARSEVTSAEIAILLLSMANLICEDALLTSFDTELYTHLLSPSNGIIANARQIDAHGGGTDITLPIRHLLQNDIYVDRIIILSDNEINSDWDGQNFWRRDKGTKTCQTLVEQYKREINPDVWVHAIDLQGYGTQQFKGKNVNIMAGWSERILEFISLVEKGETSLIKEIEGYYFK